MRISLLVSRYHRFVTDRLESGARACLREAGLDDAEIRTWQVPGAFELPQAAQRLAESKQWDAVVCLGCVIRGETPHFEYIAHAVAEGITRAAQVTGIPIAFGVVTTHTAEEALARAGDGATNKGREAAAAALDMVRVYAAIDAQAARTAEHP
jgi:6,7-dimethyl-8-ribityllumazine synthase